MFSTNRGKRPADIDFVKVVWRVFSDQKFPGAQLMEKKHHETSVFETNAVKEKC